MQHNMLVFKLRFASCVSTNPYLSLLPWVSWNRFESARAKGFRERSCIHMYYRKFLAWSSLAVSDILRFSPLKYNQTHAYNMTGFSINKRTTTLQTRYCLRIDKYLNVNKRHNLLPNFSFKWFVHATSISLCYIKFKFTRNTCMQQPLAISSKTNDLLSYSQM